MTRQHSHYRGHWWNRFLPDSKVRVDSVERYWSKCGKVLCCSHTDEEREILARMEGIIA